MLSGSMCNEIDKNFTWVIKDFSSLESDEIYSDDFVVGGCKWCLTAFPKGNEDSNYLSLYLEVSEFRYLPSGWKRHANFTFTIVNKILDNQTQRLEAEHWFNEDDTNMGFPSMIPLSEVNAKDSGFLVNGELEIVATVEVLEVIGELDVVEETSTIDVNGFQLLPSKVKSVRRLFERHPEVVSKLSIKNPIMKSAYMNLVLSLIETLRHSPKQITKDDLADAYSTLGYVTNAGFRLDWLMEKLDEVSETKEKVEACETRMEILEEELMKLKIKCLVYEELVEKEKSELLEFSAPLSDDDII